MEKKTITKWLIFLNDEGEVSITEKEVNRFAPINRVLDKVGYFNFNVATIDGTKYLYVYEKEEEEDKKTKLLISRIHDKEEKIVDMQSSDYENVMKIIHKEMKQSILVSA